MKPSLLTMLVLAGCSGTSGSVLATDMGVIHDLTSPSDLFGVGPTAVIFHPGSGTTYTAGTSIPFVGHAMDPVDGALTGNALVWRSDLAGQIGTGEMFSATLGAGTHVVTMTATDSRMLTDAASVNVIVN
jgi:hypothetical protein